ncbi:ribosome-associated GTPase EngA [Spirochaeta africana DSM 8902]|uniref:GTPase Der n=1 Tax=Spirochaeta africana (strain ATCC 700263 / DSM 8902 / Z-7692) TaxID=889378 RepID=H9UKH9_SPIAZ|nr:ribosome-associated GTPase EngA [Spirochaeta africana DSM 8902]
MAIVGRPNVGKSTLCNRLTRTRRSITDPTPGVTRDPVESLWELRDVPLLLVDTGGVTTLTESLARLISDKAYAEIERADAVVLLLDVEEVSPEDHEIIRRLRPFFDKLILAVNKVDNSAREQEAWNLLELGFADLVPISAAHGLGIDDLEIAVWELLSSRGELVPREATVEETSFDPKAPMRIGILGQPNTGKSTLVNQILQEERSIVSDVAGTTRDVVEGRFRFDGIDWTILDTAGIRRKRRITEDIEYYSVTRAIGVIQDADVVFLMIDAQKGLSDQDKKIAGQVVKHGRGIVLVLNKWDLMPRISNQLEAIKDRISFVFPILAFAPIVPLSAIQGDGIDKLLRLAVRVRSQLHTRIETGILNKHLQAWLEQTPPPTKKGRRWKVRYITQVSVAPIQFVLFVNRRSDFPESYQRYILNRIRKQFGLTDVPVTIELRDSRRS